MALWQIKHRLTAAVLFARDCDSMRLCVEAAVDAGADLAGADLAGADLAGADLAGADLAGADLADADLARANLARANLEDAYLADANLARADLEDAYLADANLARANLAGAGLAGANLAGAYLAGANLAGADLAGAKGIRDVLSIGPIGSRRDYLQALRTDDGIVIHTGCFRGQLADFEAAVQSTHGDNEHGQHYRLAIALINAKLGGAA